MNILAVQPWYPANAPRFLVDAFEQAGANVFRVGPCYFSHGNADWQSSEYPKVDVALPHACPWQVDHYVDQATAAGCAPDLVIISEETYHNYIFNTNKIPSVLWSLDGWPENFERITHINPTRAYTNHPFGIRIHPRDTPDPRWAFLPGACAPWIHQDMGIPRDITFCLHASMYGERQRLVLAVAESGGQTLSGFVNTARFVKGMNRALTTYHNTNGQEEVKWRFFEAMAMGCCVISGPTRLLEVLGYYPGQHYVPIPEVPNAEGDLWPTSEHLIQRIQLIAENKTIRKDIVTAGKTHTLANHTYFHRIRTILQDLEMTGVATATFLAALEKHC